MFILSGYPWGVLCPFLPFWLPFPQPLFLLWLIEREEGKGRLFCCCWLNREREENEIQSTFALVLSPCCSSCSLKSLTSAAGSLASAPQPSYSLCWCRTSVVCSLLCLLATLYSVMQPWSAFSKWLRGGKWERCWNRKGEKESKHSCAIPFPSLSCFSRLHSQIAHFAP